MSYSVITAQDGREAVKCAREGGVDIILMDCVYSLRAAVKYEALADLTFPSGQMPVMDGHAATREIRALEASGKIGKRTPIIALTANVTAEAEATCRNDGACKEDHFEWP